VTFKLEPTEGDKPVATIVRVETFKKDASKDAAFQPENPDLVAKIKSFAYDEEKATAELIEDMNRCEREGDLDKRCIVCDEPELSRCAKCKHANYCSKEVRVKSELHMPPLSFFGSLGSCLLPRQRSRIPKKDKND
jgi:hypothetical protein